MLIDNPIQHASVFEAIAPHREYATTGQRFANYIIDMIVVYSITLAAFFVLALLLPSVMSYFTDNESRGAQLADRIITLLMMAIVYTLIEGATKGKSLGKLITKTRAVDDNTNEPINWIQALKRSFGRIVPFEALSGFSGYPWHDKWSGTRVVRELQY